MRLAAGADNTQAARSFGVLELSRRPRVRGVSSLTRI